MNNKLFLISGILVSALVVTEAEAAPDAYRVQKGDTAYSIARSYDLTVDALKKLNPNVDLTKIRVGQVIKLKPHNKSTELYKVQKGEGVISIARKYGITVPSIYELNPGLLHRPLRVKEQILVRTDIMDGVSVALKVMKVDSEKARITVKREISDSLFYVYVTEGTLQHMWNNGVVANSEIVATLEMNKRNSTYILSSYRKVVK